MGQNAERGELSLNVHDDICDDGYANVELDKLPFEALNALLSEGEDVVLALEALKEEKQKAKPPPPSESEEDSEEEAPPPPKKKAKVEEKKAPP